MSFRISGLAADSFRHLYGQPEQALTELGVRRCLVDRSPGFPDRIELRDAEPGETVLLLNYTHQPANTPYRSSHAIYVREGAESTYDQVDQVPAMLRSRQLSVRAFDATGMMRNADVVPGSELEMLIERLFSDRKVAYLHAHFAQPGCFAACIERH